MSAEHIRARLAAATPGPWDSVQDTYRSVPMHRIGSESTGSDVAQVVLFGGHDAADAEFIANAPTDIAKLLAALDAVEALAADWSVDAMKAEHYVDHGHGNAEGVREAVELGKAAEQIRAAINGALGVDG